MSSLDCRSWRDLRHSIFCQFITLTLGIFSLFFCHFSDPISSLIKENYTLHISVDRCLPFHEHRGDFPSSLKGTSIPFRISLVAGAFSALTFSDIYCVLFIRLCEWKRTIISSSSHQTLLLTIWITVTWTSVPVIYYLGSLELRWFDPTAEQVLDFYVRIFLHCLSSHPSSLSNLFLSNPKYALSYIDIITNIVFMNVLSEIHSHTMSPEEAIRHKLKRKQQSHESQRVFLRYVFHEVI